MPYSSVAELPDNIKKLPTKKQRQWMKVFNSAYESAKDDGKSTEDAESSSFAQANSVVKKYAEEIEKDLESRSELSKISPDASDVHVDGITGKKKKRKGLKGMKLVDKFVDSVHSMINKDGGGKEGSEGNEWGSIVDNFPINISDETIKDIFKVGIYNPTTGEIRPHTEDTEHAYSSSSSSHTDYRDDGEETTGESESKSTFRTNVIIKGIDRREWIVYGEVMIPTANGELVDGQFVGEVEKTDAHNHFTTEHEIRNAMIGFMEELHYSKSNAHNIQHDNKAQPDTLIVENFQAPANFMLGKRVVKKGTWVMGTKINSLSLRKDIESGRISGYSIEGKGSLALVA